jgi:hypothetical protein
MDVELIAMKIVYSQTAVALKEGETYRNPRFFAGVEEGVEAVSIHGDWPEIAKAHLDAGVDVSVITPPAPPLWLENAAAPLFLFPVLPEDERSSIHIPNDWRELRYTGRAGLTLRSLASKLSDEPILNRAQAEAAVMAELARRLPPTIVLSEGPQLVLSEA